MPGGAAPGSLGAMLSRPNRRLPAILLAVPLALAGCKMIDQRTFERAPEMPSQAALARPVLPAEPVARLQPADPGADWRATLAAAERQAIAANPDAAFDLLTPIPTDAKRTEQDRFARNGTADSQVVAKALLADGVAPARITLGFIGDAGHPVREVRLYAH